METGVKLFRRPKGGSRRRQARRESVALRREMGMVRDMVSNATQAPVIPGGPEPTIKMGTIRALERKIEDKDKKIEVLTSVVQEIVENLPAKARNNLSETAKLVLKIE